MGSRARVHVIINPQANHRETARLIEDITIFYTERAEASVHVTTGPKDAVEIASMIREPGTLVVAGGDGTVYEAVNGLGRRGFREDIVLAVIPTGSGNDLARTLGIPKDVRRAMELSLTGQTKAIDIGEVNGIYYANSFAMGFDARVAHLVNEIKDQVKRSGLALYLTALFRILAHDYYCHTAAISFDGGELEDREFLLLALNNGATYGGGFKITPKARNDDGFLEMCLVDRVPRWQVLPRLPFVIAGKHAWMKPAHFRRVKSAVIESDEEIPAALDGELISARRYEVSILPSALRVLCP